MRVMTEEQEQLIRKLTKLAEGDVSLVAEALDKSASMSLAVTHILDIVDERHQSTSGSSTTQARP